MDSARQFGFDAAVRYNKLILAVMTAVGATPGLAGSRTLPRVPGLQTFPLRLAGRFVALVDRVGRPRHLIVYRVAPDGVVEIFSLVHDRMDLTRAARGAQRAASGDAPRDR
ncbi:MAG: hypothetical protein ACRYHQ_03795 [Janthinobacterium lividum]